MSVRNAHGFDLEEISKYDSIFSLDYFSIAENYLEEKGEVIKSFKHNHDEYEFIIPLTTIPLLYYARANYIGEVGFCYPVNPYVDHGIDGDLHSKVISIAIDRSYVDKVKDELAFSNHYFYTRFIYKKDLITLIRLFETEYRKDKNAQKLNGIAYNITSMLIKLGLESGADNRRPERRYAKNMYKTLMFIYDNYLDPELTVEKIAEQSGYSFAYFTKAFKLYMSDTPIMHLNKLRISHAKELLKDEKLSLGEIATQSGYKNLSTFTEAFKRIMGMLPSEYRNKYTR